MACGGIHEFAGGCIRGIPADVGGEMSLLFNGKFSIPSVVESEIEEKDVTIERKMMFDTFA